MAIKSFRRKGLRTFFESGSRAGVIPAHVRRLRALLIALDQAEAVVELDQPGFRLHQLRGDQAGRWSLTVQANWRITFDFIDSDAYIVDYEDYH